MPNPSPEAAPRAYHHGNLRAALVAAAIEIAAEAGPDSVTVREAARRVGVSPAAPFRHFATRAALLTAVAEETMAALREAVTRAATAEPAPAARMRAIGRAYLRWALEHPTQFQIISARRLIDFEGSATLGADNAAIQALMRDSLAACGALPANDPAAEARLLLALRGTAYGLARMQCDGHLPQWGVDPAAAEAALMAALDLVLRGLLAGAG